MVPTVRLVGSAFHCARRRHRALGVEGKLGGRDADELNAGIREHRDLIVVALHNIDVHQLRKIVDGLVALVLERSRRGVVLRRGSKLLVDVGDARHGVVGALHRVREAELRVAAQALDIGGHAVELLGQHLRRAQNRAARGSGIRRRRQSLQRCREVVVYGFERAVGSWRAVDALQPVVELGAHVGITGARAFDPHLALHELIELALNSGDVDADASLAGSALDLDRRLADIARRLRVRHVGRNDGQPRLRGAQAGHRRVERLGKPHDPLSSPMATLPPRGVRASGSCSGGPEPSDWRW